MKIEDVKYGQVLAKVHGPNSLPDVVVVDCEEVLPHHTAVSVAVLVDKARPRRATRECQYRTALLTEDLPHYTLVLDVLEFFSPVTEQPKPAKLNDTEILDFLETGVDKIDLGVCSPIRGDSCQITLERRYPQRLSLRSAAAALMALRNPAAR